MLETLAPAKLNLALEVTGRRGDGYHDIVTVMQTIDLADRVRLSEAGTIEIEVDGEEMRGVPREGPRNLAYAAAQALAEAAGDPGLGAHIELQKSIPAGTGLGGGSSDAAAVLRGLNRLWRLGFSRQELVEVAARLGSDVPFFLSGGAALVTGRGEQVEELPDGASIQVTLFLPDVRLEDKTRRMYGTLGPLDYSDGHKAHVLAGCIRRALPISSADLANVFDPHAREVLQPVGGAMSLCRDVGLALFMCGSGPAFFSLTPLSDLSNLLRRELEREWGVRAVACRSLPRDAATAVTEV